MNKLNLGQELSKNEQKKILGGATLTCWSNNLHDYVTVYNFSNCSYGPAYCQGAHNGYVTSCS
ncbi:hypothetical protein [Flagellimonas sediminis]|uniref:Bacteriocin n=1 Tax=Flagellimonas sediminis TaxID=2696468 RepID=A0A6I5KS17_9FLAO|nr:hypothetical protein [Allomuricauda sediminis]NDV43596.1 hypothetical protein [Allomuricauda sediminis]